MKKILLIAFLATTAFIGCNESTTESNPDNTPIDTMAVAAAVWKKMVDENYNSGWAQFPGKNGIYAPDESLLGKDPHMGPTHFRTFVTASAGQALKAGTFPLPEGAIVAKENYVVSGSDTTLMAITVMTKRKGFDPANGDWFWVKFKPDGTAEGAGAVPMCINCHKGAASRDYVWTKVQ